MDMAAGSRSVTTMDVTCADGMSAMSGGWMYNSGLTTIGNSPDLTVNNVWHFTISNPGATEAVKLYVVCIA
jgi:hypothetical protein